MADPEAQPAPAGDAAPWRGIDELARVVGAYCWVEGRVFALSGGWCIFGSGRKYRISEISTVYPSSASVHWAGTDSRLRTSSNHPELFV